MKRTQFLCIGFLLLFIFKGHGQENIADTNKLELKKNAVYTSLGYIYGGVIYSVNAERMLLTTDGFLKTIGVRLGVGERVSQFANGFHLLGTLNALTGVRASHFEMNVGMTYLDDEEEKGRMYPAVFLGYRLQRPDGRFVFRAGVGFPDFPYLSLGFCF